MKSFEQLKIDYNKNHNTDKFVKCFLPVNRIIDKIENNLYDELSIQVRHFF